MKTVLFLMIFLFLPVCGFTAFRINDMFGARALSLAGAFCAQADDGYALLWNPAGTAQLDSWECDFSYENLYQVADLSQRYVGVVFPIKNVFHLGLAWTSLRFSYYYSEDTYILMVSRNVTSSTFLGMNLKYFKRYVHEMYDDGLTSPGFFDSLGVDISILTYIKEYLSFGAVVDNINNPDIVGSGTAPRVRAGFSFQPLYFFSKNSSHDLILNLDLCDERYVDGKALKINLALGAEYNFLRSAFVRLGMNLNNDLTFGAGIKAKGLVFDYAYRFLSPVYGASHIISASYRL